MENINPLSAPAANSLKCPPTSTPLHNVSPDRMNQQRIPPSPSPHGTLIENERPRSRDSNMSDVQPKVAFLNSLTNSSSPPKPVRQDRKSALSLITSSPNAATNATSQSDMPVNTNSAFQRAVMGYEEAQASLATLSAELERAKEEILSRKKRERMVSSRVEILMEELQNEKDKRVRDQEAYTKEVKRCRKETYRAELGLVESREELKDVRNELKKCQAEVLHEKSEKEKGRQEAFERAYTLAGVLEEVEQVKDRLKVAEKERDAALEEAKARTAEKATMADQVEAIQASQTATQQRSTEWMGNFEGHTILRPTVPATQTKAHVPLPSSKALLDSFDAIKFQFDLHDKKMQGLEVTQEEEIAYLNMELQYARQKHKEDEDLIHFMHMQCHFKACPCRIAEENGERFVHDHAYEAGLAPQHVMKKRKVSSEPVDGPPSTTVPQATSVKIQSQPFPTHHPTDIDMESTSPLENDTTQQSGTSEEPVQLEEAAAIPLPEPLSVEVSLLDHTPEPTAQLEEITQVLVEPGTTTKPFSFSTSTRSNANINPTTVKAEESSRSCAPSFDTELFDLSPPKQSLPRRPSTAMGILTIDSPIRLVPDSAQSYHTIHHEHPRTMTSPPLHPTTLFSESTVTTKIALKDTPPRSHAHKRTKSRSNVRSHSPFSSSTDAYANTPVIQQQETRGASASPATTTMFPITPLLKHPRSIHGALIGHQDAPQTVATTTTTTRVPLRGMDDTDDVFSPVQDQGQHAHTEIIRMGPDSNGYDSKDSTNHAASFDLRTNSILGNIPGTPISREAALAQIRARRDRARSVNLKRTAAMVSTSSSGAGRSPTKPRAVNAAAGLLVRDKDGPSFRREISQASAPGRLAY
ncbi:hypothetical protein B0A52_07092 [Exophiala mesophila]|uniref:Uncharacterized protein n=1 Tax=Exophiala mesophila TaxID=212818 RepID=A0A438MY34_EXOME|nr:hypothetical protein B0A52_07092 [Exophiala mesophila]